MTLNYVALLLAVTAAFAYFNHFTLALPRNVGLLAIALAVSLALVAVDHIVPSAQLRAALGRELQRFDFAGILLHGFLGYLLFAGAIGVNLEPLLARKATVLALATVGVLISTALMAAGMWGVFRLVGLDVPVFYCLAFGALISPTDPVTVLAVLRRLAVPQGLQAIIAGESLFNDGIGIVLYSLFLQAAPGGELHATSFVVDFAREAGGGFALGLAFGGLAFALTRGIDEQDIELMISLALATASYGVAQTIGVSGPVAVVTAGLLMGNYGARYAVSRQSREYIEQFWSTVDELLNALLFLLIGLQFAGIPLDARYLAAAALAIPLSLAARAIAVVVPGLPLNLHAPHKARAVALLTWSGLRGGISVALALSLPPGEVRSALLTACYGVVIFTMVVQGLSLGPVAKRLYPGSQP